MTLLYRYFLEKIYPNSTNAELQSKLYPNEVRNNFLNYINNFRGLAIVLIVAVHCRNAVLWPKKSVLHDLLTYGLDSSTILFVFISGFLFQYLNADNFNYAAYLNKKLKYVIVPYLLVSIPYILDKLLLETNAYWMTPFYKSLNIGFQVIYMLFSGKHSGPFYFIPTISIIFLISPFLHRIQKSHYFSIVTFVIVSIGLFTYTYGYYSTIGESFTYFLPVYFLGMWVSKHKNAILDMKNSMLMLFVFVYLLIFYFKMSGAIQVQHLGFFKQEPHFFTSHFNWSKFNELLLAIILLSIFFRLRTRNLDYLSLLGTYSFGIYFTHIYFVNSFDHVLNYFLISLTQEGIGYLFFTLAVMTGSILTVYLIKKVFKDKSRLLIGS